MSGIYIHIPFCKSRCIYCGFYSTTGKEALIDRYVQCLVKELRHKYHGEHIRTVYLGGGTPSVLSIEQLGRLIAGLKAVCPSLEHNVEEFTVECNPDDVTEDYAQGLRWLGINRVSMGVQTFSDDRLRFLRRRHNSTDAMAAVRTLRNAGFRNISIDLMFGFPDEDLRAWQDDIDNALHLGTEHISAYSLMYEEGTPLYNMLAQEKIRAVNEETSREMFEMLMDRLEAAGYEHYEISNFAKPGFRSQHNSSYWHDVTYIGLGAGAHSYDGRRRSWNVSDVEAYIRAVEGDVVPCQGEEIDAVTHYNDLVTAAMRTREGIDLDSLEGPFREYIVNNAQKAIRYGNLVIEDHHLHLTRRGIFISDDIMSDLIYS